MDRSVPEPGSVADYGDVFARTTANRLLTADFLEGLDDEQWQLPTLCEGWDVRTLAAHLLQPVRVGFGRFFITALRYRGDTDRVVDHVARRLARLEPDVIISELRAHAGDEISPPRVGPMGPFADICIHLRDMARPLGSAVDAPADDWRLVLDYLTGPAVAPALVREDVFRGLRLEATDTEWATGQGPRVAGAAEALALAITGRREALRDLTGAGADALDARLRLRS